MTGREDFGHRPVWIDNDHCGGCPECGDREEREVCDRCVTFTSELCQEWVPDPNHPDGERPVTTWCRRRHPVTWPCTTARLLDLVDPDEHPR